MRAKNSTGVVTRRCFTSPIIKIINPFLNCFGAYRAISTSVGAFAKYDIFMWGGRVGSRRVAAGRVESGRVGSGRVRSGPVVFGLIFRCFFLFLFVFFVFFRLSRFAFFSSFVCAFLSSACAFSCFPRARIFLISGSLSLGRAPFLMRRF